MPVFNGLDASRELENIKPSVSIILSTQYADLRDGLLGASLLVDGRYGQ
jgi:hypothetical protein